MRSSAWPNVVRARHIGVEYLPGRSDAPTVVVIPGIQGGAAEIREHLRGLSIWTVYYPRFNFKPEEVVRELIALLWRYHVKEVVFIGMSMGGLVAAQTITELTGVNSRGLILWDSPREMSDLRQAHQAWWACLLCPISWLLNPFSRRIFVRLNGPVPPEPWDDTASRAMIQQGHQRALSEMVSSYLAKLHYIKEARRLSFDLFGIPTVYIRSAKDSVVGSRAVKTWRQRHQGTIHVIDVPSSHCGLLLAPTVNQAALREALGILMPEMQF